MSNYGIENNYSLVTGRQGKAVGSMDWNLCFVTNDISDQNMYRRGGGLVLPLFIYDSNGNEVPNLDEIIVSKVNDIVGVTKPADIFDYNYAILHSTKYRKKYKDYLDDDFPRIPYPGDKDSFWKLVELGRHLRELHLLTHPDIRKAITTFPVSGDDIVSKPSFKNGKAYINDEQYWDGVPEEVWNFYVGGYQPAQKYLKDRKDKKLSSEEFANYEKMIVSLNETIKVMAEIDKHIKV